MRLPLLLSALVAAAAQAQRTGLPIDPNGLTASTDTFAVQVKGLPLGGIRSGLEKTATGFRYSERNRIGGILEQSTVIEFDATGVVTRIRQQGSVQGEATSIEVDYAKGRVIGKASTTGPDGPKTVAIDTTVPPGTVDDNAIQPLLRALPWSANATWSFGVFSSGQNEYRTTTLTVTGVESVALDTGPVEAFRVDWTGGWQPATFWIATVKPHRIVKIGITDTPVEIVRVR